MASAWRPADQKPEKSPRGSLVNVEAIPFDVLAKGVTWDWTTFPEYMNAAQKRGIGLEVGFMAPLTPFRHFVMGEESMERSATPEETVKIAALLREAFVAGALGLSTTNGPQHIGYQGRPLACRLAAGRTTRRTATS